MLTNWLHLTKEIGNIEADYLSFETKTAVKSFLSKVCNSSIGMLGHIYWENVLNLYPNLSIVLPFQLTVPVTMGVFYILNLERTICS